jgi:hypothetical protein
MDMELKQIKEFFVNYAIICEPSYVVKDGEYLDC